MLAGIKALMGGSSSPVAQVEADRFKVGERALVDSAFAAKKGIRREENQGLVATIREAPFEGTGPFTVEVFAPAGGKDDAMNPVLVRRTIRNVPFDALRRPASAAPAACVFGRPGASMCSVSLGELHQLGFGRHVAGRNARLGGVAERPELLGLTCTVTRGPDEAGLYEVELSLEEGERSQLSLPADCLTIRLRRGALDEILALEPVLPKGGGGPTVEAPKGVAGVLSPRSWALSGGLGGVTGPRQDRRADTAYGEVDEERAPGRAAPAPAVGGALWAADGHGAPAAAPSPAGADQRNGGGRGRGALPPRPPPFGYRGAGAAVQAASPPAAPPSPPAQAVKRLSPAAAAALQQGQARVERDRKFDELDAELGRCCAEEAAEAGLGRRLPANVGAEGRREATGEPARREWLAPRPPPPEEEEGARPTRKKSGKRRTTDAPPKPSDRVRSPSRPAPGSR